MSQCFIIIVIKSNYLKYALLIDILRTQVLVGGSMTYWRGYGHWSKMTGCIKTLLHTIDGSHGIVFTFLASSW